MFSATPIIKKLFWANIVLFILTLLTGDFFYEYFAQWNFRGDNYHFWQLVTHQFLHGGFVHIIFNMLALVSIGPFCEEYLGERKFLPFYILSGIGAALLHMSIVNSNIPMVGASGAIFGLLALFAFINPNEKLYLFLIPFGIKAKYLTLLLFLMEITLGIYSNSNRIGHWAHVGGGLTGIVLYFLNKKFFKNIY
jgi:membrane associated rhomboid family serine protease